MLVPEYLDSVPEYSRIQVLILETKILVGRVPLLEGNARDQPLCESLYCKVINVD